MRQYVLLICTCFAFFLQVKTYAQQQTVAHGQTTGKFALPAGACAFKYHWTNDRPDIGLPAFGTGDIPAFTAINNTNANITANIKVMAAGNAYIASNNDNSVTSVDLATFQATPINIGKRASRQLVGPDGKFVYIVSYADNAVVAINTADNTFATINTGSEPDHIALNADGSRLYVASRTQAKIRVYNTANNMWLYDIPVQVVSTIILSPDDTKLYAVGIKAIYEINIATSAIITHPLAEQPAGSALAISKDGKELYLPMISKSISVFNTDSKTVIADIFTGEIPIDFALSSDGKSLYSTVPGGPISVIDIQTKAIRSAINVAYQATGIDLSGDGSLLYVNGASDVQIYNTADNSFAGHFFGGLSSTGLGSFIVPGACPTLIYTITVTPPTPPPVINVTGALAVLSTTYGTPSPNTGFHLSATALSAAIQVNTPVGFEASIDDVIFSPNLPIPATGGAINLEVYIRLAANASAGIHTGDITLNTPNAAPILIPIPNSTVAKASLSIVLDNITKAYGSTLNNATAITGFNVTGLKNGETITAVNMVYGTGAAATDPTATYTAAVDCNSPAGSSFDHNNYDITTQQGSIIVTKAVLTVTADNKTRVFGAPNPVFTYTFNGFVNNETTAELNALPVASTTADVASPAGQYTIYLTGAAADNYSFDYITGTLTIKPFVPPPFDVPGIFTPNGDGINDIWAIKNIENAPNCTVDVFNRAGQKVFTSIGYGTSWDGSFKNKNAPAGTYYYIIDPRNGGAKLSGTVVVIR